MTYFCMANPEHWACVTPNGACEIEFCGGNHLECCQWCTQENPGSDHCGCCALFDPDSERKADA